MKRTYTVSIVSVILVLVVGLVAKNLFSADLSSQETAVLVPNVDISVSPFKGPDDAPVQIVVFTCFE
jgi:hypothetical protein